MKVLLKAVGNVDFNEPRNIGFPGRWVDVKDLAEASKVCRTFLSENGLGCGNWAGGQIREGRKVLGRVSYNGRVWGPDGAELLVKSPASV